MHIRLPKFIVRARLSVFLLGLPALAASSPAEVPLPDRIVITVDDTVNKIGDVPPLGINLNFFNDNDHYLKPARKLSTALREMGVRYLRYPGGDKSDYYLFSVPPYDHAVATPSQTGPGTNQSRAEFFNADRTAYNREVLNFDEYMTVCRETGAEPVIVCAIDTYIQTREKLPQAIRVSTREDFLRNAVEWVRYANVEHHDKIKYWMLGNESWLAWYKGPDGKYYGYEPEVYAQDLVDFSTAMKAVDPSIKIIANGVDWTVKRYLPKAAGAIDYICTSNYPLAAAPYASYDDWLKRRQGGGDLLEAVNKVVGAIQDCPSLTPEKKASLKVIVSEFGPHTWWPHTWGNAQDLGHALFNFDLMGEELSDPDILFSLFWNTRWEGHGRNYAYDALDDHNNFSPDGQSVALWCHYLFPQMVTTSAARGLITYATWNRKTDELYLDVINQTGAARTIAPELPGETISATTKLAELSGPDPGSAQTAFFLDGNEKLSGAALSLDPYSVTVFHLQVQPEPAH
jgi:alpha-N-arabinofuranosidase